MSEQPFSPQIDTETSTDTMIEYRTMNDEELEKPYRIILENDDVTPMHIVTVILMEIFDLSVDQASNTMLEAHISGHAVVAVLPYEEAHEKVHQAQSVARELGYPLKMFLEPDE